ncbi:MAG: 2-oxoacid:ferredoxin oxidoreductase subunit beta, partial [Synergistaceae bacterium]|nr:2-oxoacid:ferredoxin oxidoreductase subunit beta [Synergistaceae bacterium]
MPSQEVFNWLRTRFFPHIWCPGCGHGIIMHSMLRALVALKLDKSQTVIASGIGCSSRMAGYIAACTMHTTHGRSLAFATGIKLAKPELTVIDVMGDGDCTAIGGNHFIPACRRNI